MINRQPVAVESTPKDTAKQEKVATALHMSALIIVFYIVLIPGCWLGIPCAIAGYFFGMKVEVIKLCVTHTGM